MGEQKFAEMTAKTLEPVEASMLCEWNGDRYDIEPDYVADRLNALLTVIQKQQEVIDWLTNRSVRCRDAGF